MSYYPTSSQRLKWTYDAAQVEQFHSDNLSRALEIAQKQFASKSSVDMSNLGDIKDTALSRGDPPTLEEEAKLRKFYERQLLALCTSLQLPHKVHGAAVIFFKRFYTKKSMLEHHPKGIMLTCIYLACKSEERYVSSEQLARVSKQKVEHIVNNELRVLAVLDFELVVFAPYRPLNGLLLDFNAKAHHPLTLEQTKACYELARGYTDDLMLTDAPLIYSPGLLALAALLRVAEEQGESALSSYLQALASERAPPPGVKEAINSLAPASDRTPPAAAPNDTPPQESLPHLRIMLEQGAASIDEQEVRTIDMKLRQWSIKESKQSKESSKKKLLHSKRVDFSEDLGGLGASPGTFDRVLMVERVGRGSFEPVCKRRKSDNSVEMRSPPASS